MTVSNNEVRIEGSLVDYLGKQVGETNQIVCK